MASDVVTVAVVQASPVFLNLEETLAKGLELIQQAAGEGAELIVFPEAWMPGYPVWVYGLASWEDKDAKRLYATLHKNSVEPSGSAAEALCGAAKRHGADIAMGVTERPSGGVSGTLYNSLLFISRTGDIRGVHRKLMPTHAERIVWGLGDGSGLRVFDTPAGRLGGLICWEHWMPLARFAMHARGEQVHVAAWPALAESHELASRHYAFEGRCYVVSACSYLTLRDLPDDPALLEAVHRAGDFVRGDVVLDGGSGVIGPDGRWIAGPVRGEETIVYASVDLSRITEEHQALDVVGHYNRPDVFEVTVYEHGSEPVAWRASRGAGPAPPSEGWRPAAGTPEGDASGS